MKIIFNQKLFSFLAIASMLSACSMKDRTQAYQVNVQMPNSSSANAKFSSPGVLATKVDPSATGIPALAAAAGFRCFALNVVGSGIPIDPRFNCNDPSMGQMVGMADITGGSVSADVLAGPSRTIQLIGVMVDATSTIQGCPSFDAIFAAASAPGKALNGVTPYNLGQATTDIYSDVSVPIVANFSSEQKMFNGCGNGPGNGALNLNFSPAYPNLNAQQVVLSNTASPGTFFASGGKAPYHYTATLSNNSTSGTLTVSSDTTSAVFVPPYIDRKSVV